MTNSSWKIERQWIGSALVQIMACHYSAPSHYLNHCWVIVNCTLGNKLQWNSSQNTKLSTHENASENIFCEMPTVLSSGRWAKITIYSDLTISYFTIAKKVYYVHNWISKIILSCRYEYLCQCKITTFFAQGSLSRVVKKYFTTYYHLYQNIKYPFRDIFLCNFCSSHFLVKCCHRCSLTWHA